MVSEIGFEGSIPGKKKTKGDSGWSRNPMAPHGKTGKKFSLPKVKPAREGGKSTPQRSVGEAPGGTRRVNMGTAAPRLKVRERFSPAGAHFRRKQLLRVWFRPTGTWKWAEMGGPRVVPLLSAASLLFHCPHGFFSIPLAPLARRWGLDCRRDTDDQDIHSHDR